MERFGGSFNDLEDPSADGDAAMTLEERTPNFERWRTALAGALRGAEYLSRTTIGRRAESESCGAGDVAQGATRQRLGA